MAKPSVWVPYVVAMVVVIVEVVLLLFQHRQHVLERLLVTSASCWCSVRSMCGSCGRL